jgi:hypothetical protein
MQLPAFGRMTVRSPAKVVPFHTALEYYEIVRHIDTLSQAQRKRFRLTPDFTTTPNTLSVKLVVDCSMRAKKAIMRRRMAQ